MRDDELMDELLRQTLAGDSSEVPRLSPRFDADVMARVRPRQLTTVGRALIGGYVLVAAGVSVWLMKDLPMPLISAALAATVASAAGLGAYGRHLVNDRVTHHGARCESSRRSF